MSRRSESRDQRIRPRVRSRSRLLAFAATSGVVLLGASFVDPYSGAMAIETTTAPVVVADDVQQVALSGDQELTLDRQTVKSVATATPVAGDAAESGDVTPIGPTIPVSEVQSYARTQVLKRGWSEADFTCLVKLWNRESHWNYKAQNRSSGAYGIAQALPGSKMASAGADWATNPETQVRWGLGYIAGRYGTPCGAWQHSVSSGWY